MINELQRLNQQVQNNLDRYREASREQRVKEQQQYESQIKYLEQSTQQYLQENSHLKEQSKFNREQLDQLRNDHEMLKNQYQIIIAKLNDMKSHLAITQDDLNNSQKNEAHWKIQYQGILFQLENQKIEISDLLKQVVLRSSNIRFTLCIKKCFFRKFGTKVIISIEIN
jgi:chromosome segregation ATPase